MRCWFFSQSAPCLRKFQLALLFPFHFLLGFVKSCQLLRIPNHFILEMALQLRLGVRPARLLHGEALRNGILSDPLPRTQMAQRILALERRHAARRAQAETKNVALVLATAADDGAKGSPSVRAVCIHHS